MSTQFPPFQVARRLTGDAGPPTSGLSGKLYWNDVDGKLYIGSGSDSEGNATSFPSIGIKNAAPTTNPHFTGFASFNSSLDSTFGRVISTETIGNATSNFSAISSGNAQGEIAGYTFYSTFMGGTDNVPRRSSDIISGFDTGNWGKEYLSFNVGLNGTNNDSKNLTIERARINGYGEFLIGTSISDGSLLQIRKDQNTDTYSSIKNNNTGATASSSLRLSTGTTNSNSFISVYDNSGTPYSLQGVGSGIINSYWKFPNYNFQNISGTNLFSINSAGNAEINGYKLSIASTTTTVDKGVSFFDGTSVSANLRFAFVGSSQTSDGANVYFKHYDNSGTFSSNSASINRLTGIWTFTNSPIVPTASTSDSSTKIASTEYVKNNLLNYSLVGHTQAISTITGLQTALDGKQPLNSALTSIANATWSSGTLVYASSPTTLTSFPLGSEGQILMVNGGALGWTTPDTVTIPVTSVAGKTGAVTLVKGDVGLGNVDNTTDLNKPISTATQTSLNTKANLSGGNVFSGGGTTLAAATATYSSLNIPAGIAPSTPTDGDIWRTSTAFYGRSNGVTQGFVFDSRTISTSTGLTGGGDLTANRTLSFDTTWGDARYLGISANAATATKWATGRTISLTGDITGTSGTIDGSANSSFSTTLATVNSNVGSFGSSTSSPTFTVNAKGLITAASNVTITPAWSSITGKPTTISGFGITDAPTTTGTGASGTWGIDISGNAAYVRGSTSFMSIYSLPDTGASTGWIFLGTWNSAAQTGSKVVINLATNNGYNANVGVNAYYTLFFKTSNNSAFQAGSSGNFYGDGLVWKFGAGTPISVFRVVQISNNSYAFYASAQVYTGTNSYYGVSVAQGSWTNSATIATPSGNYIDLTINQVIDSSNYNTYSPTLSGTGATGTWGIGISGNAATATKWATGRTISLTGDITGTSSAFDGSANTSFAATLATVNSNVGTFGGNNSIPSFTVNAKGLITAASATTPSGTWGISISGSAATLTTSRNIQTNLASTSAVLFNGSTDITPGVTGTLSISNGGTGATTSSAALTNLGIGSMATRALTVSTASPSGGSSGDVWFMV